MYAKYMGCKPLSLDVSEAVEETHCKHLADVTNQVAEYVKVEHFTVIFTCFLEVKNPSLSMCHLKEKNVMIFLKKLCHSQNEKSEEAGSIAHRVTVPCDAMVSNLTYSDI